MTDFDGIDRLTRDLKAAAITLGDDEVRFLVDSYYMMQEQRKRSGNQVRALSASEEPHAVLNWLLRQSDTMEGQIKRALSAYAENHPIGSRMLTVVGIGPVITAGLLAHINMEPWVCQAPDGEDRCCKKAPHEGYGCHSGRLETVGKIWRFAGLDPTVQWKKGQKRPWNADLKTLCWKIGESFVKTSSRDGAFYGPLYQQRKAYEHQINAEGGYEEQAAAILKARPSHAQAAIYAEGRLPDGHIHARAKRWAVKMFLSHLHEVWYRHLFKEDPPVPYVIEHMGHTDVIAPPF